MLQPRSLELVSLPALPIVPAPSLRRCRRPPMRAAAFNAAVSFRAALRRPVVSFSLPFPPVRAFSSTAESLQLNKEGYEPQQEMGSENLGERRRVEGWILDASGEKEMRALSSPSLEVIELEELPEQWRRSRIAWLCKELPAHKPATIIRVLNAQRKWIRQPDATYIVAHCMRIREYEAGFRVYKWMVQQHWFHFDFALATKLADHLGKDRKFAKCREMFDAIITQGRVPSESTFHILTVAYLSAPVQGCLDEACTIYNRMIQLGGYRPRLSLHNSLFRALVSKPGGLSRHYLKQAEFIYHQLVTSEFEVHKDISAGLIWLHSYQDDIDRERIASLREEMRHAGIEESRDVLVSIMRAFSKGGDVDETERAWLKLIESGGSLPFQAFVYRMELYAKISEPMKSLEIFKGMKEQGIPINVAVYNTIIEVMSEVPEVELVEELVDELINSGMKPLTSAFLDLMKMYLNLGMHDKLEVAFSNCIGKCRPNRSIYHIYLKSLVRNGNLEKAEAIFNEMHMNATIGTNAQSCNTILGGYLSSGEFVKAEKIYDLMCQKKYEIEPQYMEKLDYILSLNRKVIKRPVSMKLDKQQREILMGLLIGGLRIQSDEERRNHAIHFEFNENSNVHSLLKIHIHERFFEWLKSPNVSANGDNEITNRFSTIAHTYFGFFADQFSLKGRPMIPKLIHRWLSPRVLAYWYMYGGLRTSSGDILLKLKGGNREDVERIAKIFQAKSLTCRVKRKGKVFWIGFQGENAVWFWKLTEPYILDNVKDFLTPEGDAMMTEPQEGLFTNFDSESDTEEPSSL
ncbi:hypothetical protein J5N97_018894 [Dioscorea zingiberensis]|uniref:Homing endonuclease LAGLIDADG domain-containing protein n=1 Tax=Dioscorea zingiberensis TaxID=325984 RepID=A0A9D5HC57_9LILI|nr:hypothetical protein J5N97_018894 [Dioscorea zingiberensis]